MFDQLLFVTLYFIIFEKYVNVRTPKRSTNLLQHYCHATLGYVDTEILCYNVMMVMIVFNSLLKYIFCIANWERLFPHDTKNSERKL